MPECERCHVDHLFIHSHHREPKSLGGSDDPENIWRVCRSCHEDVHWGAQGDRRPWDKLKDPEIIAKRVATMKRRREEDPEVRLRHAEGVRRSWTDPDKRAARMAGIEKYWADDDVHAKHGEAISAGKKGRPMYEGQRENLAKGWTPEVHARAIAASADVRRGRPQTAESNAKRSESLKAAYAAGARKRGHSDETRAKISAAKKGRGPTLEEVWAKYGGACAVCGESSRKHGGRGVCVRCVQRERTKRRASV